MRVGETVAEPLLVEGTLSGRQRKSKVEELLKSVGLDSTAGDYYPHQFSGGQRQRIAIARALAPGPELLVLDEPTSSLDVSTRAQIMNLLKDLQVQFGLTIFMISHDLPSVRYMVDRLAVMYLGKVVEIGAADRIYRAPAHPYTKALLKAVPSVSDVKAQGADRAALRGEVPSPLSMPSGCRFHPRCPSAFDVCPKQEPGLIPIASAQQVACHLYVDAAIGNHR